MRQAAAMILQKDSEAFRSILMLPPPDPQRNIFLETLGKVPLRPESERERRGQGARPGSTLPSVGPGRATLAPALAAGRSPGGLFQGPLSSSPPPGRVCE